VDDAWLTVVAGVGVCDHLDLHVSRCLEVALEVDGVIREVRLAFTARRLELGLGLRWLRDDLHPSALIAIG
jgi:hypothetical protein